MSRYKKKRKSIKILSLIVILVVIFFVVNANIKLEHKMQPTPPESESPKEFPVVINLEYFGYDSKNHPYKIIGEKGFNINEHLKKLTNASAEFETDEGTHLKVKAATAELDKQKNKLTLLGDSKVEIDDGSALVAPKIQLFYDQKQIFGNGGVVLNTKSGSVEANEFVVSQDYNKITFRGGRVKSTIYEEEQE